MDSSTLDILDALDESGVDFEPPADVDGMMESLLQAMARHERVVLVAGPRSGKSTLTARAAERFKAKARHADSLIHKLPYAGRDGEWDMADEAATWLSVPGKWITEGVVTARAIRKWLADNPEGPVPFAVVKMPGAIQLRTDKQEAMAKGVDTVWAEIEPQLVARGAEILTTG